MNTMAKLFRIFLVVTVATAGLLLCSCSTPKIKYYNENLAMSRYKESILLIPPLSTNPTMESSCQELGKFYQMALSQYTEGQVTYAGDIESLKQAVMRENIVNNGIVNLKEVSVIAKTLGCNSAITVSIVDCKRYPPFRMVVDIIWIDCLSASVIARMYDDIDMTDTETYYRFENFVGDGMARTAYEQFAPYKAISQTAALKPSTFLHFVASYSTRVIMDKASDSSIDWRFWRIF